MNKWAQRLILVGIAILCLADTALAQRGRGGGGRGGGGRGGGGMRGGGGGFRGGGGGGFSSRGGARSSVTRPASRPAGGFGGGSVANRPGNINNRPGNINNRPGNINNISGGNVVNNRKVNVADVDVNGGWGGYGDWNDGCCFNHPVAAAAAIGTAAAVTSAALGSVVYSLPSSCSAVVVDGITYEQCGSTWYQPQFMGTETTYVVVSPP